MPSDKAPAHFNYPSLHLLFLSVSQMTLTLAQPRDLITGDGKTSPQVCWHMENRLKLATSAESGTSRTNAFTESFVLGNWHGAWQPSVGKHAKQAA